MTLPARYPHSLRSLLVSIAALAIPVISQASDYVWIEAEQTEQDNFPTS